MTPSVKRSVLVTGCSSGLGRATALLLLRRNWRVFATARTKEDLVELASLGCEPIELDLRVSSSVHQAAEMVAKLTDGTLDALVNNAGYAQYGATEDLDRDRVREQFETNVFGTLELTNLILPVFRRNRRGKIIFISSICGRFSFPYAGVYCASKFALEAIADALRRETRGSGVTVQVLQPGSFRTPGAETAILKFMDSVKPAHSLHEQKYVKRLEFHGKEMASKNPDDCQQVAQAVVDCLEGNCRRPRRIIPARTRLYDWVHRFFPDELQDFLISFKDRFNGI